MRNHPLLPVLNEDTRVLECQRQLLQVINFFPVKGTHSILHFWICMSSFQLKKNFASCDKALTKTVTWVLTDEEVEFPFSTGRLKSPQNICQIFLLALWADVSLSNNHLKQNQFRLASLGTGAHCDMANNFCFAWQWGEYYTEGWETGVHIIDLPLIVCLTEQTIKHLRTEISQ